MKEIRESIVLSNNGQKIFGILHLPEGVKKPPCVVVCHGLGGNKIGHFRAYVELAEALVKEKIAVFRFDFRGSGDSEGAFDEMTLHGEVSDAVAAVNYLKTEKRIDSNRIGIFGRSLGGAVAVLCGAEVGFVQGMALWAPIFNGDQWKHEWAKVRDQITTEQESQEMRRINGQVASLAFYAELFSMRIDVALKELRNIPMLIIHGEQDTLMKIHHSELYIEERRQSKMGTEFIRLPKGDHDFSYSEERAFAIQKTAEWFKELWE